MLRAEPVGSYSLTADAFPPPASNPPEPAGEWPQLWFALLRREWSSLVVVPADRGVPALFAARALVGVARLYRHGTIHLLQAESVGPAAAGAVVATAGDIAARGEQSIIAVDCPLAHHAAIHIARSADAALLVVPLGTTALAAARRVVECVGRERFIGSVAVNPAAPAARPSGR